jgi:DNA-binding transcriptional ArsR family regulator
MTPETDDLSADQAFDILSNRRRRYALHYLSENPGGETLQELARQLAAWENEIEVEEVSKKQQKRVYVSLYQTHIPKLESEGIVEYDDDSGNITLTRRADGVTTYLRDDEDRSEEWYRYYLVLLGASSALFVATVLEVPGFSLLTPTVAGLVILLAFGLLTGWYVVVRRRETQGVGGHSQGS